MNRQIVVQQGAPRAQSTSLRTLFIVDGGDGWPRYSTEPTSEAGRFVVDAEGGVTIEPGTAPDNALRARWPGAGDAITLYGDV